MLCRFLSRFVCSQRLRMENATMRNKKTSITLAAERNRKGSRDHSQTAKNNCKHTKQWRIPGRNRSICDHCKKSRLDRHRPRRIAYGRPTCNTQLSGKLQIEQTKTAMELEISSFFGVQSVWSSMSCGFTLSHFQIEPLNMIDSHQI